jgi:AcrR family transcriptional regulator
MPAEDDPRKARKAPRQARSRATVEAILEAATRILETEGLAGLGTNRIAEYAGVSIGSLYQYYPARDAILAELVRRMRLSMSDRLLTAIADAAELPLEEAVPKMLRAALHQHETNPRLTAALEAAEARLPTDHDVMNRRYSVRDGMIECLRHHGVADPKTAAVDIIAMTRGIVMTALSAGNVDFDAMRARTTRAALGYLAYRAD